MMRPILQFWRARVTLDTKKYKFLLFIIARQDDCNVQQASVFYLKQLAKLVRELLNIRTSEIITVCVIINAF